MPAVNPARLHSQIEGILKHFGNPAIFHRGLEDLFSQYANRILRFGEETQPQLLMLMFHLPDPLVRQLKLELNPLIKAHPNLSLELSDELWRSDYYEIRLVASHILGQVPVENPEPILTRLKHWLTPGLETKLTSEILSKGAQNLAVSHPQSWESFLDSFISRKNPKMIAFGIIGYRESLRHAEDSNLPTIFRNISPIIQNPPFELLTPLRDLIKRLAEKYPEETLYFLRQSITLSSSPTLTRLIKQSLLFFNAELQDQLKAALQ